VPIEEQGKGKKILSYSEILRGDVARGVTETTERTIGSPYCEEVEKVEKWEWWICMVLYFIYPFSREEKRENEPSKGE